MKFLIFLSLLSLLFGCSIYKKNEELNDYLIIENIFSAGDIDNFQNVRLYSVKKDSIFNIYLNGNEDDYTLCKENNKYYFTNKINSKDTLQEDVFYYFDDFLKNKKKFQIKNKYIFKVNINGCYTQQLFKDNSVFILPTSIEIKSLSEYDKKLILNLLQKKR